MTGWKVTYQDLLSHTQLLLRGLGYPERQAELTARVLVEADARGVPSHGVSRLAFYRANIQGGFANPAAEMTVVYETPLSMVVDGNHGVGPYISDFAMRQCITRAQRTGAGFVAVRNSNHFGMAGLWAEQAAAQGQIGLAFTNTRICAIPTFGKQRILGTNPICCAIPQAGREPFLLDMATTTVAHGKIEVYERRNQDMPLGWVVDETGRSTADTRAFQQLFWSTNPDGGHLFLGGEGEEFGGHKGYGLGLLVDLLCAGLSLGRFSYRTFAGTGSGIAHFFAAFSLNLFGDASAIQEHVAEILEEVRRSHRAAGQPRIFIHGEKETEQRVRAMTEGIEIDPATWELLGRYADEFGVPRLA